MVFVTSYTQVGVQMLLHATPELGMLEIPNSVNVVKMDNASTFVKQMLPVSPFQHIMEATSAALQI